MEDTPMNNGSKQEQQEVEGHKGQVENAAGESDAPTANAATEEVAPHDEGSPIHVRVISDTRDADVPEGRVSAEVPAQPMMTDEVVPPSSSAESGDPAYSVSSPADDEAYERIEPSTPTVRHAVVARTQSTARAYTSTKKPLVSRAHAVATEQPESPHRPSVRNQKVVHPGAEQAPVAEDAAVSASRQSESDTPQSAQPRPRQRPHVEKESAHTGKLTPKLIVELAAPHTWAASTMPVLLAISLCIADTSAISISTALILLVICVLMQSAVNTINDYFDYVKGTDTAENQDDPTDAVLVYNDIDPKQARNLALIFLGAAFVLGIFMIVRAGWIPLVIALIGAVIVFLYSGGRTPISYLPIGEVVSGFTMGGLIPLACYQVLTLDFSWTVLVYAIPVMIGIALIMMTNNTCDIEKDIEAERKTLPTLLGRDTSVTVYRSLLVIWLVAIVLLVIVGYPRGWYGLFFLVAAYGPLKGLFTNPFTSKTRGGGMAAITSTNAILGMGYAVCLLMSVAAFPVL